MKKYCENVVNETQYMNLYCDNNYMCESKCRIKDLELINDFVDIEYY